MKSLAALVLSIAAFSAQAGAVFSSPSISADISFQDALTGTTMTIAYANGQYYSSSGGGTGGTRLAQYDSAGVTTNTYAPGLDFRSVFSDKGGHILARAFGSNTVYRQDAPGVFTSLLTLTGGSLDSQASVVMNAAGEFVANSNGLIDVWSATGEHVNSFNLAGYSGSYPASRGVAVARDVLLTYADGQLSAWDYTGNFLDSTMLDGVGSGFDTSFSLSSANNHVFLVTAANEQWLGFDVGLADAAAVPEPGSIALFGLALAGMAASRRRKARD